MSHHLVDVDDHALSVARAELGTTTINDTVNENAPKSDERAFPLEIGYAARNVDGWDRLVGALDAFEAVETSAAYVARALQAQRRLAARSRRGRKRADLLVAAAGEALNLAVLHNDADFEQICAATGQAHRWVRPAGTVD